jgi:hypothetical protein
MIIPRLVLALALCATPALAQDASSSSAPSLTPFIVPSTPVESSSSTPAAPQGMSDAELEMAVRAAYTAAAAFASAHGNYFARDGGFGPLRDAIAAALAGAYPAVVVPAGLVADLDAARVCLAAPGGELRVATNIYGDGITLVAVTDTRVFAYDYDPHQAADIRVIAGADCLKLQ